MQRQLSPRRAANPLRALVPAAMSIWLSFPSSPAAAAPDAALDATAEQVAVLQPTVFEGDLRDLPIVRRWRPGDPIKEVPRRHPAPGVDLLEPLAAPRPPHRDALLELQERTGGGRPLFARSSSRSGRFPTQGFTGSQPADPVGDVGPTYFIQAVNSPTGSVIVAYRKSDNSIAAGPIDLDTLGSGNCSQGLGDPFVVRDGLAGRWVLGEFSVTGNALCISVSRGSDPLTSGYNSYQFNFNNFPDYPKLAVWNGTYVVTTNEAPGPRAYALESAAMQAGTAARVIQFRAWLPLPAFGFQAITPSDVDGPAPPADSRVVVMRHIDDEAHFPGQNNPNADFLEYYELAPVFGGSSSIFGPSLIEVAEFDSHLCGYAAAACFPQPMSAVLLDPLHTVILHSISYRNMSGDERMVGNFTVDVDGSDHGGIRWFELRKTSPGPGAWTLLQEGTYAPDADHRFMGSINIDRDGNIVLGMNVTSATTPPSIVAAGRKPSDPLGTLPRGESLIRAGTMASSSSRWGDYTSMKVDGTDGCTFWYTAAYTPSPLWQTETVSGSLGSCGP